ncbi:uncharacterized protein LOC136718403 [Amia ocellicauda]|uniref:uncharacterized protein LOC136718403 n=1 Tax=Amia ocellicauda TaxID=2972642 RepID=UPI003463D1B7
MKVWSVILWILWLASLSIHAAENCMPAITMRRESRIVAEGQSMNLSCSFFCIIESHSLQWCKARGENCDNQSLINFTQINYTFSLLVEKATETHSGQYFCQTVPTNTKSNMVTVIVTEFHINVSSAAVTVCEGVDIVVNCTASFHHDIKSMVIFWAKGKCLDGDFANNSRQVNEPGLAFTSLTLSPSTPLHSGEYHCCASLPTYTPLRKNSTVQIIVVGRREILDNTILMYLQCKAGTFCLLFIIVGVIQSCRRGY